MPSRATPLPALGAALSSSAGAELDRAPCSAPAGAPVRRLASSAVFAGTHEVLICHRGIDYRLRQTAQGKLILTK